MDRSNDNIPAKCRAVEALASHLFWELEKLDHSGHFEIERGREENWLSMPESERAIYTTALGRTLLHRDLVMSALGEGLPDNNGIQRCGRREARE